MMPSARARDFGACGRRTQPAVLGCVSRTAKLETFTRRLSRCDHTACQELPRADARLGAPASLAVGVGTVVATRRTASYVGPGEHEPASLDQGDCLSSAIDRGQFSGFGLGFVEKRIPAKHLRGRCALPGPVQEEVWKKNNARTTSCDDGRSVPVSHSHRSCYLGAHDVRHAACGEFRPRFPGSHSTSSPAARDGRAWKRAGTGLEQLHLRNFLHGRTAR